MHPEDAASALALRGRSVGCAEVMEKHSGDQCCQATYMKAVSRQDLLSKNYSFVNN